MFASPLGSSQDLSFIQGGHPTDTGDNLPQSFSGLFTFDASNPSNCHGSTRPNPRILSSGLAALVPLLATIMSCLRHAQKHMTPKAGEVPIILKWAKAELAHDARAQDYYEVATNERHCELMEHPVQGDEALTYQMSGVLGDPATHQPKTGRRRWSML